MSLTSGPVNAFFADLFINLNRRLARATTAIGKGLVVQEARQYLRGAEALWGYTKPVAASSEAESAGRLLEHLFLDANAYIAEVERQLALDNDGAMAAQSGGLGEGHGPPGTLT